MWYQKHINLINYTPVDVSEHMLKQIAQTGINHRGRVNSVAITASIILLTYSCV